MELPTRKPTLDEIVRDWKSRLLDVDGGVVESIAKGVYEYTRNPNAYTEDMKAERGRFAYALRKAGTPYSEIGKAFYPRFYHTEVGEDCVRRHLERHCDSTGDPWIGDDRKFRRTRAEIDRQREDSATREREIWLLRESGMTYRAVGEIYHVGPERIRQIHAKHEERRRWEAENDDNNPS